MDVNSVNQNAMTTTFQKAQKVLTPDGEGIIEEIQADAIIVRLDNGEIKTYHPNDLSDDSAAG